MEETGEMPSPFLILLELYGGGGDDIRDQKFGAAWERYTFLFKEKYGQELNPELYEPDFVLWDACEEVAPGKKGRHLGFGSVGESDIFAAPKNASTPSATQAAHQALLEAEVARRLALEREMEEMKEKARQQENRLCRLEQQL